MGNTVPGGRYIDGENYVDANGKILGKAPKQENKSAQQVEDEALAAQQEEYNGWSAEEIVSRIEGGRLTPGDAQRLEEASGKNRKGIAEAIRKAQSA